MSEHNHTHTHVDENGHVYEHSHGHHHSHAQTKAVLNRLSRAQGHLDAVRKMVERGEDCAEVLAAQRGDLRAERHGPRHSQGSHQPLHRGCGGGR